MNRFRACPCGSGLGSEWQVDARGIELTRTCLKCHKDNGSREAWLAIHMEIKRLENQDES